MLKIEELRRKRAEINAQVQQLATKDAGEGLSADELASFETLSAEFESLTAQIGRLEAAERMNAAHAAPVKPAGSAVLHIKPEVEQYKGAGFARIAMAVAASQGNLEGAARFARDEIGDVNVMAAIETTAGSGGALIPTNTANEVIELLRNRTVVRKLGARSIPLPNGNMALPRISGGSTSGYVGEGNDVLATGANLDDVKLSAKTMITLVPISNQLIGRAGRNVEEMILGDMLASMAVREDKAFLRDDGSTATPTGFRKVATDAGRVEGWSGTADLATIDAYLDSMILRLMNSNSMMIRPGWAMSPRSFMKLSGLLNGNGNKVYPEMAQGLLKGIPIQHTNTVPQNLGVGSNESEIYLADWNDVIIGEDNVYRIDFSKEATYKDDQGNLVSAFSRNQSLIRVVTEHDIGFRHNEGLVLGNGVTW